MRAGYVEQAKRQAIRAVESNLRDRLVHAENKIRDLETRLRALEGGDIDVDMD